MSPITTISTKGQVTIPEEIRQALGINIGDKALFEPVTKKTKKITFKVVSKNIINELYGSLKTNKPYIPYQKARQEAGKLLGKKYAVK